MTKIKFLLFTLTGLALTCAAHADIEWSGVYRVEAINMNNPELGGKRQGDTDATRGKREVNYALSTLILRPKIVAGDGLTIHSQFHIFNNSVYKNSQLGAAWGSSLAKGATAADSADDSASMSASPRAETIQISQLYMTLNQEYGSLIVGRAPIQFGLGMTYSAGRGLFDHWYDSDDLVGYKFVIGNLWVMPMIGKHNEGELNLNSDDVNDYMVQLAYENPESGMEVGVFYQIREAGVTDAPTNLGTDPATTVLGGQNAKQSSKLSKKTVSLYALRESDRFRLGLEAAFQSGETGVVTNNGNGDNVTLGGFGVVVEGEYRPEDSRWRLGAKAGLASGDDPTTTAKYEGFHFNRNYDVAMLMFNHPLGADDFLRSRLVTGKVRDNNGDINAPDVETVSNVLFVAPNVKYAFSDRWSLDTTVATGWLSTNPLVNGKNPGKDLGYEWDISLNFAPRKGVMWINQMGLLFPGGVWKGDNQYDANFAYGLATKAAISF